MTQVPQNHNQSFVQSTGVLGSAAGAHSVRATVRLAGKFLLSKILEIPRVLMTVKAQALVTRLLFDKAKMGFESSKRL